MGVEGAAEMYFRRKGWMVSPSPHYLLSLFGVAEAIASQGVGANKTKLLLLGKFLFHNKVCDLLRSSRPSDAKSFAHWLRYALDVRAGNSSLNGLSVKAPLENTDSGLDESDAALDGDDLFRSLMMLHNVSPRQTWQTAYLLNEERFKLHGNTSGAPDLLIWNDETYRLVEVKSPNDSIIKNQSLFYCSVVKPLNINMTIGAVSPLSTERIHPVK
jgi:hypothetical protein